MCNKVSYKTKSDAKKDADFIKKSSRTRRRLGGRDSGKDIKRLKPYLCPVCGDYHLTTAKQHKYTKSK